jgi:type I restriction enzyme S subunit
MSENDVPGGWSIARLGDFCVERVEQGEPVAQAVPYIDIGSIDRSSKTISISTLEHVTNKTAPTRARQWVQPGDVLVSMTRPNLNAVALVPPALKGAVASTGFDVLRPVGVLPEWVFNRVRSHEFVVGVCDGLQGVVYPAIRPRDVRQHQLPIPPLTEQRRIVQVIETNFSRLDDAVATLERVQRNLKRYRASVLKAAVEGRLVPTESDVARAEGRYYEPASALLERILAERSRRWKDSRKKNKCIEPAGPDIRDLPDLPEGWCWATVSALTWDADYGTSKKCTHDADGPPVLRIPNVQREAILLDDMKHAASSDGLDSSGTVEPGDLLFIRTNGSRNLIGRGAVVVQPLPRKHYFASYLIRLRIVKLDALPRWLALAWHTSVLRDQILAEAASSAGQYNVSLSAASSFMVPLPPLAEQGRILAEVERATSLIDAAEASAGATVERCAHLRQSILRWAFEGRLTDQGPNDEPAHILLSRIRAKREAAQTSAKKKLVRRNARARATA